MSRRKRKPVVVEVDTDTETTTNETPEQSTEETVAVGVGETVTETNSETDSAVSTDGTGEAEDDVATGVVNDDTENDTDSISIDTDDTSTEIEASTEVTPDDAAEEETPEQRKVRIAAEKMERNQAIFWARLDDYVVTMNTTRPNNAKQAAQKQRLLLTVLRGLVTDPALPEQLLFDNLIRLRDIITEHSTGSGAFNERTFMRNIEDLKLHKEDKAEFMSLLFVLREVAANRKKMVIDWGMLKRKLKPVHSERTVMVIRKAFNFK